MGSSQEASVWPLWADARIGRTHRATPHYVWITVSRTREDNARNLNLTSDEITNTVAQFQA